MARGSGPLTRGAITDAIRLRWVADHNGFEFPWTHEDQEALLTFALPRNAGFTKRWQRELRRRFKRKLDTLILAQQEQMREKRSRAGSGKWPNGKTYKADKLNGTLQAL